MNKKFWDALVIAWCKSTKEVDEQAIRALVDSQVKKEKNKISGYSINPLDDEDDEEDYW